jgi:hypothetical protein
LHYYSLFALKILKHKNAGRYVLRSCFVFIKKEKRCPVK